MLKAVLYIVLTLLFLYEAYKTLIKKEVPEKMRQKYTEESLKTYALMEGIACIVGALGGIVFILAALNVLDFGIDILGSNVTSWIVRLGWLALVIVICVIGSVLLKKKDPSSDGGSGSSSSDDEDF